MDTKQQYGALDRFRIVAAFLIVAIHTYPLMSVSETLNYGFVNILSRIAVPFFLMVTGYFAVPKMLTGTAEATAALLKFAKKTGQLYLLATLIYLPLAIYAGYYSDGNIPITILKNIFLDGTFYHLWYLPASIIGAALLYALSKKLSLKPILAIAAGLYIIGIFGDSYYGALANAPAIKAVYDIGFDVFSYTRNGIFYAPVFLALGAFIAKSRPGATTQTLLLPLTVFSLCLLIIEGYILRAIDYPRHDSMYIMLLPFSYFLFRYLIMLKGKPAPALRDISLWVYILHPLFIAILLPAARLTVLTKLLIDNSIINYIAICALSLATAIAIEKALRHKIIQKNKS